jgi:hypothetical protein
LFFTFLVPLRCSSAPFERVDMRYSSLQFDTVNGFTPPIKPRPPRDSKIPARKSPPKQGRGGDGDD